MLVLNDILPFATPFLNVSLWQVQGVLSAYSFIFVQFLPLANEVCEGYVFTGVCLSTRGGHVWLLWRGGCVLAAGGAGMRGCSGGGCMVALGWGACVVFSGGGACVVFSGGVCVVFSGGGVRGFVQWVVCVGYDEIRSMSGRYASYWNAFLFRKTFVI